MNQRTTPPISLPHPNTYALPPARLLAGEYPFTPNPAEARRKLRAFLESGIDYFVDLTEDGELEPYEAVLQEESERMGIVATYVRHPVRDTSIPQPERMTALLDCIDDALAAGHTVYVHCWGGIGRTGTVVGCYLVRHGSSGEEALERVAALFGTMSADKLRRHPEGSPQTSAQRRFVRQWADSSRGA